MKPSAVIIVASALLALADTSRARPLTEPSYSSDRPLYAMIVLDEEATRILTFALDESGGTGKGYDILYADLNLNGDLTDDAVTKGQLIKEGNRRDCSFPPLELDVSGADGGTESRGHWEFTFGYYAYGQSAPGKESDSVSNARFNLQAKLRLEDGGREWEYSFRPQLFPMGKPDGILAVCLITKPFLIVRTGEDKKNKGNTGIAAYVIGDDQPVDCKRTDQPVTAHVELKNEKGNIVLSEDVKLEKMFFG